MKLRTPFPPLPNQHPTSPIPPIEPRTTRPASRLLALVATLFLLTPSFLVLQGWQGPSAHAEVTDDQLAAGGVLRDAQTYRVAPGLDLTNFSRLEEEGWNNGSVLTADLGESSLSMDVKDSGKVASQAPLTDLMRVGEDGDRAVAAVNGTFFDINKSNAPNYTSVSHDGIRMGTTEQRPAITMAEGQAAIQALSASGTLTTAEDEDHELSGINAPALEDDEIGVYTDAWGDYTLDGAIDGDEGEGGAEQVARATVVDGEVTESSGLQDDAGDPDVPEGGQVLLGRDGGADTVADLAVGDEVDVEVGPDPDVDMGIAGSHQILEDGEIPEMEDESLVTDEHPRTAVGLSRDGSELFVLVLDGRTEESRGMTLPELGQILADMGAHNAMNLDGGGSSALAARVAGVESETIWNSPSDGEPRDVTNALVFYSSADPEELSDVQTTFALEDEDAVFPGMHRTVEATGLGENLDPVMAGGEFSADGSVRITESDAERAVVRGGDPGSGTITYAAQGHQDSQDVRVLGTPIGLQADERALNLSDSEDEAELTISGFDADGRRAVIETGDLEVSTEGGFTAEPDGPGSWRIGATGESETGSVTFTRGELSTTVALTHGTDEVEVLDLTSLDGFSDAADRATGSLDVVEGPDGADGDPAIGMTFDFSTGTATRGYYLVADEPVTVDGSALAFTMDVRGDGNGAWPRLQVTDGNGTVTNLDGDNLEFEGWQNVRFTVPDGLAQPVTVERVRMMETRPEAQYSGDVAVANLRAITTPEADTDPEQTVHDPALLADGSVEDRPQQIAVMSDAQFVASDPESDAVEGARRTLREIREEEPDLLVINGDFVDEASPEDFELAQQILDEEWDASIPYVYVPGNHEIMGGEIDNFEDAFGDVTTDQNPGRTKVVSLNSSAGSLGAGGIDQVRELEETLEAVGDNDTLTGAVVFFHHPPTDPLPSKASQLEDQREARAIETLLADFRAETGKSVALVNGHVGVFHGAAVEGVTTLINGNSGKSPAGTPATGGFVGWTMLGVNPGAGEVGTNPVPEDRTRWLAAETRPWVDDLRLEATSELTVGGTGEASATILQDGNEIPVGWPATAQWGGDHVQVVPGSASAPEVDAADGDGAAGGDGAADAAEVSLTETEDTSAAVRVNPATGEITGLRPGTATLTVTVNGTSTEQEVVVRGEGEEPTEPEPEEPTEPEPEPTEPEDDGPGGEDPGDGDGGEEPGGDPDDDTPGSDTSGPDSGGPGAAGSGSGGPGSGASESVRGGDGVGRDALSDTGSNAWPYAIGAVALIALGSGLIHAVRRRG